MFCCLSVLHPVICFKRALSSRGATALSVPLPICSQGWRKCWHSSGNAAWHGHFPGESSVKKPTWGPSGCALHPGRRGLCSDSTWDKQGRSWHREAQRCVLTAEAEAAARGAAGIACPSPSHLGQRLHLARSWAGMCCQPPSKERLLLLLSQAAEPLPAARKVEPQHGHGGAGEGASRALLLPRCSQWPQYPCALCDLCRNFNNNQKINKIISLLLWDVDTFPSHSS